MKLISLSDKDGKLTKRRIPERDFRKLALRIEELGYKLEDALYISCPSQSRRTIIQDGNEKQAEFWIPEHLSKEIEVRYRPLNFIEIMKEQLNWLRKKLPTGYDIENYYGHMIYELFVNPRARRIGYLTATLILAGLIGIGCYATKMQQNIRPYKISSEPKQEMIYPRSQVDLTTY